MLESFPDMKSLVRNHFKNNEIVLVIKKRHHIFEFRVAIGLPNHPNSYFEESTYFETKI